MRRALLLIAAAVLLVVSQPFELDGFTLIEWNGLLAWIALVPWWIAVREASPKDAARDTFAMSLLAFCGLLYWVFIAMHRFGDVAAPVAILGLALLAGFCALFPTLAAWIGALWGETGVVPRAAAIPVAFAATEWLRGVVFTGFPWSSLGHSQWRFPMVAQVAELGGVHGLSALIVLVNVALAEALVARKRTPLAIAAGTLGATLLFGALRMTSIDASLREMRTVRVALAQGNVTQDEKHDRAFDGEVRRRYNALLREATDAHATLAVWPEAAIPGWIHVRSSVLRSDELFEPNTIWLLAGAGTWWDEGTERYSHNSALLVGPGRVITARYDKRHLVPFGEFVPWPRLFFFLKAVAHIAGSFVPGATSAPLVTDRAHLGVLICYEDVFPDHARETAREGADLLVVITNDAWYGHTSAAWQHAAMDTFRAIETRRSVVRAAQTGITSSFDPAGRLRAALPNWSGPASLVDDVPVGTPRSANAILGDLCPALAAALASLWLRLARDERARTARASGRGAFPLL